MQKFVNFTGLVHPWASRDNLFSSLFPGKYRGFCWVFFQVVITYRSQGPTLMLFYHRTACADSARTHSSIIVYVHYTPHHTKHSHPLTHTHLYITCFLTHLIVHKRHFAKDKKKFQVNRFRGFGAPGG